MSIYERRCRTCETVFRGGPRAWYCPACRAERDREAKQKAKQRQRAGIVRKLGSTDLCAICGKPYSVKGGLQRYCESCGPEHLKQVDHTQSIAWNQANKAVYYPAKNEKRRRPVGSCEICGDPCHPPNSKICGKPECKRLKKKAKREQWLNTESGKAYAENKALRQKDARKKEHLQ